MARRADPALLEGEELERWYLRTPEELDRERALAEREAYDAYFGTGSLIHEGEAASEEQPRWRQVRLSPRTAPPAKVQPAPERLAPGVSPYGEIGSGAGGFFGSHGPTPSPNGDAYLTDLPSPLNYVRPRFGGWYELGDGSVVKGAVEVDRIYAEQQDRLSGEAEDEPLARVRSADRFKDGRIPQASELAKGEGELDPTCHPNGGWEVDAQFPRYPQWTKDYEEQITRAPGLDYVVRNPGSNAVKFDGCAVWTPRRELLEAKGPGYASLFSAAFNSTFANRLADKRDDQAGRQREASQGRPIDWHVAERGAVEHFRKVGVPPIRVIYTAPR